VNNSLFLRELNRYTKKIIASCFQVSFDNWISSKIEKIQCFIPFIPFIPVNFNNRAGYLNPPLLGYHQFPFTVHRLPLIVKYSQDN